MRVLAGTSGYSYKEWKWSFDPDDLPASRMLAHYAERLPAVEINNTFYRMPSKKVVRGWTEQVPEGFRFSLKASMRITHKKRLKDAGDDRLGPMLFQLPPGCGGSATTRRRWPRGRTA